MKISVLLHRCVSCLLVSRACFEDFEDTLFSLSLDSRPFKQRRSGSTVTNVEFECGRYSWGAMSYQLPIWQLTANWTITVWGSLDVIGTWLYLSHSPTL